MKIAIPASTDEQRISEHFGHCKKFKIFEIENDKILNQFAINAPEHHEPGALPQLLKDNGVNVVIAGGIGLKAINIFNQENITVITGAVGNIEDILKKFINGTLKNSENICSH